MAPLPQRLVRALRRLVLAPALDRIRTGRRHDTGGRRHDTDGRRHDTDGPGRRPVAEPAAGAHGPWPGRGRLPRSGQTHHPGGATPHATSRGSYAGDFGGVPTLSYAPIPDDRPDPGEVVWAWIPYEEDHSRGKDRPALVIGRHEGLLLALPMTSKDHDRDLAQEASVGRHWCDVGSGSWDERGRPSEVRVDRILQLDPGTVRRIGAVLPQDRFERVAEQVRAHAHR